MNVRPQSTLILNSRCAQTRHALLEEEPAHFVVPFAARPDHEDVPVPVNHPDSKPKISFQPTTLQTSEGEEKEKGRREEEGKGAGEGKGTHATGAFEIHVLLPFSSYPPSEVLVATVSIPAGSEPWFGSVRPYLTNISECAKGEGERRKGGGRGTYEASDDLAFRYTPNQTRQSVAESRIGNRKEWQRRKGKEREDIPNRGRYFSFCSALPNSFMGCMTSEDWTDIAER